MLLLFMFLDYIFMFLTKAPFDSTIPLDEQRANVYSRSKSPVDWTLSRDLEELHSLCFSQQSCELDVPLDPVDQTISRLAFLAVGGMNL